MTKKSEVKSTHKGRGLTEKQKRFVDEYLIDLNATQAAIRAGYSKKTAYSIGQENLKKPEIQQVISKRQNKRIERIQITQDEVIKDLLEYRDLCMGRKPITLTTIVKNPQEGTAVSVDTTHYLFEPTGANKAFELLGKHLRMFKDKVELSGANGEPIQLDVNKQVDLSIYTDDELRTLIALSDKASKTDSSDEKFN